MYNGRETPGNSIASSSGKIGITGGSVTAPGALSGGADCARTMPPANQRPTIPPADASLLDCIRSPFGHAASDALGATGYTRIATALCRYDDLTPPDLSGGAFSSPPARFPASLVLRVRRTYEPTFCLS